MIPQAAAFFLLRVASGHGCELTISGFIQYRIETDGQYAIVRADTPLHSHRPFGWDLPLPTEPVEMPFVFHPRELRFTVPASAICVITLPAGRVSVGCYDSEDLYAPCVRSFIIHNECVGRWQLGDDWVTTADLRLYLDHYFEGTALMADLDDGTGSGTPDNNVGIEDLLYFLNYFGTACT